MEKRLARREKSRVLWIDGVRFLAFGVVFTRHYFESFFRKIYRRFVVE